MKDIDFNYDQL